MKTTGLTLIEAVKSGNEIRSESTKAVFHKSLVKHKDAAQFSFNELMATDWEIVPQKIEITEDRFDELLAKYRDGLRNGNEAAFRFSASKECEIFKKDLGFK